MGSKNIKETGEALKIRILSTIGLNEKSTYCRAGVSRLNLVLAEHTLRGYTVAGGDDDECERMLRYIYDLSCVEKREGKVYYAVSYVVSTMIRAYNIPRYERAPLYKIAYLTLLTTHPIAQRI